MTAKKAKTPRLHVSGALATAQPWVRDHYSTLRAEAGPRWEHAKTVVVPVVADTTAKVREDYLPAAAQTSSHLAAEAARRTAPYRAELASRGLAALAAARGDVTADDVAKLQRRGKRRGRRAKIVGTAALIGAATGAGVLLWQRSHQKSWDQEDLVQSVLDEQPSASTAGERTEQRSEADGDGDDPADPDGGANAKPSSLRSGLHNR